MFYEYALEPAVLGTWQSVRYFLDAFGPWKGRFIAAYPKRWKKLVYDSLRCPDVEKKSIADRLARLDRRVFSPRAAAAYDPAKPWIDNALAENTRAAFRAIIATDDVKTGGNVLHADGLDENNPLWRVEHGRFVPRDPRALRDVILMLLRVSSRVAIVDPYFRPHQADKAAAFASLCSDLSAPTTVEVHARLGSEGDPTHAWFKEQCETHLPRRLPQGLSTTLHTWRQRAGGLRLHNRYLITDIAGIKFGDSVERGEPGEQDHISILDETSRVDLWSQFVDPGTGFDRIGSPVALVGERR